MNFKTKLKMYKIINKFVENLNVPLIIKKTKFIKISFHDEIGMITEIVFGVE